MPEIKFPTRKSSALQHADFQPWSNDQHGSPELRFSLAVPGSMKLFQSSDHEPTPRKPLVDLAEFRDQPDSPTMEILVQATAIKEEVALRHYLLTWSKILGEEVIDRRPTKSGNRQPDFLISRSFRDGQTWVARRTAFKVWMGYGAFVVFLTVSCEASRYAELDQTLDTVLKSFKPVETPEHPYAEQLKLLSKRDPFDFATYLPISWENIHHHNDTLDKMRACFVRRFRGAQIGGLTTFCAARDQHQGSREFVREAMSSWESFGVDLNSIEVTTGPDLGEIPTRGGMTNIVFKQDEKSTEYTLQFIWASLPDCRFYVELMGLSKQEHFGAWAVNQRALSLFISEFKHLPG